MTATTGYGQCPGITKFVNNEQVDESDRLVLHHNLNRTRNRNQDFHQRNR